MAGTSSIKRVSSMPSPRLQLHKWPRLSPSGSQILPRRSNSSNPVASENLVFSGINYSDSVMSVPPGASLKDTLKAIKDVQENPQEHKAVISEHNEEGHVKLPRGLPVLPAAATATPARGSNPLRSEHCDAAPTNPPPVTATHRSSGSETAQTGVEEDMVDSRTPERAQSSSSAESFEYLHPVGTKEREIEQMQRDGLLDPDMSIEEAAKKPWASLLDLKYGLPTGHPDSPSLAAASRTEQTLPIIGDATNDRRRPSLDSNDSDFTALPPPALAPTRVQRDYPFPQKKKKKNIFKRAANAIRHPLADDSTMRHSTSQGNVHKANSSARQLDHDQSDTEMTTSPAFTPTNPSNEPSAQTPLSETQHSSTSTANKGRLRGGQTEGIVNTHQPTGYTWTRDEDAPGFSWKRRTAQKERSIALEFVVGQDTVELCRKYGDIGLDEARSKGY